MRHILLVEPAYKNKFPPLGLMKLSTYHKLKGDYVQFVKGCDPKLSILKWDRIYISTLFTFYWDITIKTIKYYVSSAKSIDNVFVGGVMATLLWNDIEKETGVRVIRGLLDKPGMLDKGDKRIIDNVIPDYQILNEIEYDYGLKDAYIGYATRGCPKKCPFCAVNKIEPNYVHYLPLKKQVLGIEEIYGQKRNLVLMDNNILASTNFEKIINEIIDLGFYKGAKFNGKLRKVDFNQGTDAHYLTSGKMDLLAKTAIRPLRIAFDYISMKDLYISKIKLARDCGISNLSNYVLYNYVDAPEDFYQRLKINVQLNEELGTKIYSFPMKYIPLTAKDRSFIGKNWNKKILRGLQCVLLVTRGLISPRKEFFEAAFGSTFEEFLQIVLMPEDYIINRRRHELNGALDWKNTYKKLTRSEKNTFINLLSNNKVVKEDIKKVSSNKIKRLLSHYIEFNKSIIY
ncbi:MAG: cobalamin-binding domain-containing protein [Candidatus Kuenenia stuttgartiensis]|nr:cobalamin-binding domain-containing protein [Candidatus Kuenenia stuttgartiensis]